MSDPVLTPWGPYLPVYNIASALAWAVVLYRTVTIFSTDGPRAVYLGVNQWLTYTQSIAFMEILHSFLGVVRSPLLTTILQVSSRLLLIWAVLFPFPALALSPAYSSMLFAWSLTEVIRYSYFALANLPPLGPPALLTWLRYNTFFVLYPVGILSECSLMLMAAVGPAREVGLWASLPYFVVLLIYVPGSYILYTHMMSQRRKAGQKKPTSSRPGGDKVE